MDKKMMGEVVMARAGRVAMMKLGLNPYRPTNCQFMPEKLSCRRRCKLRGIYLTEKDIDVNTL